MANPSTTGRWISSTFHQILPHVVQEPDATVDDDTYDTGGAYYYVQAADDDQE